jgi:hypothetical protein
MNPPSIIHMKFHTPLRFLVSALTAVLLASCAAAPGSTAVSQAAAQRVVFMVVDGLPMRQVTATATSSRPMASRASSTAAPGSPKRTTATPSPSPRPATPPCSRRLSAPQRHHRQRLARPARPASRCIAPATRRPQYIGHADQAARWHQPEEPAGRNGGRRAAPGGQRSAR